MEKNYNRELDFILEQLINDYVVQNKGLRFSPEETTISIKDHITKKLKDQFMLEEWEINILYYTLLIDEHLKTLDPLTISIQGLIFHNNGGYTESASKKEKENIRLDAIQQDFRKYAYGLMLFTAIVAAGTIVSAWFFGIEIYRYYFE